MTIARPSRRKTITSLSSAAPQFTQHSSEVLLTVLDGPDARQAITVGPDLIVAGTESSCDLVLTDSTVSRRHFTAIWQDARLEVIDLESKNGSFFAGQRFEKVELTLGATFRAGKSTLKVVPLEEEITPEASGSESFGNLVACSLVMKQLFTLANRVAQTTSSILLEGETGVGKELIAEEIHRRSGRRDAPFVVFDCGAVPDELVESVLFGHIKGAFTGAATDRRGVLAEADGGTVFLDEIGELKPALQPALLRVLDRGMIRPVGSTEYQTVDIRVVAATHRNLVDLVASGSFREDLYYRLAVVRLAVPPLRERLEDVPLLVRHFLRKLGRPDMELTATALERLRRHGWPGNVRELRNVVERGIAVAEDGVLVIDEPAARPAASVGGVAEPATASRPADERRKPFRDAKSEVVEAFERAYLSDLVSQHPALGAAAAAAGMDRRHLRTLLARYGLLRE